MRSFARSGMWGMHVLLAVALLSGCRAKAPEQQPSAPQETTVSPDTVQAIRDKYQHANAKARVGQVIEIESNTNMVAVVDPAVKDYKAGDFITFINGNEEIVANGRVDHVTNEFVIVRYDT